MKYANQPAAATLAVRTNANANCVIEFCQSSLDFEKQPPPPSALWDEFGFVWFAGQSAKFTSHGLSNRDGL